MSSLRVSHACDHCGKEHMTTPWHLRHGAKRFCSVSCSKLAYYSTRKTWLICPTCGGRFSVARSTALRGRKFCSRKCYPKNGAGNPRWRGGRIEDSYGRVMVYAPNHPGARLMGGTHIYEYRLVAERTIGRPLTDDEIVHHINGDHTDNRPENLAVMTQAEHVRLHMRERRERKAQVGV